MRQEMKNIVPVALLAGLMLAAGCGGRGGGTTPPPGATPQITVTPSVVALVVNGSQPFRATVTGISALTIASTNGAVRASSVVTITTTAAHNLTAGQTVTIAGVTDATFDGTFVVTGVPTSTTFTYAQAGSDTSSGSGTVTNNAVTWSVNGVQGGNSSVGTITSGGLYSAPASLPPAMTATIASDGAVRSANTVTITTTAAHNFVIGQVIVLSGVTDATFNGRFQILTVPSTTTFTYSQIANDAKSGSGTITSFAVTIKATSVVSSSATGTAIASIDSGIVITVTPATAVVGTGETFQFVANVTGTANTAANWFVNGIAGGSSNVGTISPNGLYTAPAAPPTSNAATIAATNGAVRKSNVVTITTTSPHGFSAGKPVTIAGVSDASFNGTFTISAVATLTTFTFSQTAADATSGGGTATSTSNQVSIKAVAAADPTREAVVGVGVATAADPTLTSVSPATVAQGAVFQDVFLTGTNFISTTTARINGVPLPSAAVLQASLTILRIRITASLLAAPGTLNLDVQRQNGTTTSPLPVTVTTVRPVLVGASPDSAIQGGPAVSFNVNGGYFGPAASPVITAEFAGSTRAATVNPANEGRQANVTLSPADLATAGLFEVGVRNSTDNTLLSATNLAVQPSGPPAVLGAPIAVGSQPSSIAISQATGIAVVANRCSNSLSRIDIGTLTKIGTDISVGPNPTGVAVDDVRNLAVVVNNGNNAGCGGSAGSPSLSIVDLSTGAVSATVTSNLGSAPFSVGVNPLTGLALIVYQNSNHADILDLTLATPAIISSTTISTGPNSQIAVNPRLNWAVTTPGGAGTLSIVDLSRRLSATIAASNGASRSGGVTTITTTAGHPFQANQVVLITGVADPSFNGIFTINSVPSNTTFTFVQNGAANASSTGGSVVTSPPVATATVGTSARGIAINTFTQRAILTDPTQASVFFFNLFNQVVNNLGLTEIGSVAAAFNPFTNLAVTLNPNTNQASLIDPGEQGTLGRVPTRLATLPVGAGPRAVAIDSGTNTALVVNETDGTVTAIGLGAIRSLHLGALSLPLSRQLAPGITLTSGTDLPLTLIGKGFVSGSVVRLNGVPLPLPSSVTDRQLTVSVPAARLAGPSQFVVDVLNPGPVQSNVLTLLVVQPVNLVGAGGATCTVPAPAAVAIDGQRNLAVVTNSGCNSASIVDLSTGTITATVPVGTNPDGVAISSGLGLAVVSNFGSASISLVDLTASSPSVKSTVSVSTAPLGVAINEANGSALVANSGSASLSIVDLAGAAVTNTIPLDRIPQAVAVDPARGVAAVADPGANNLALVSLSSGSIVSRIGIQLPTAVVFDPVTGLFIVNTSLGNNLFLVNPDTLQAPGVRTGINPTSIGYNFASGTLITVNTASATLSVMDMVDLRFRDVLAIPGSPQFAVAIHPLTNLAVIADQANNRLLLVRLPR